MCLVDQRLPERQFYFMVRTERRLRFGMFARIPMEHMRYLALNPASLSISRAAISRLVMVSKFGPVTKATLKNGIWFTTGERAIRFRRQADLY